MKKLVILTVLGLSLTFASNGFAAGYGAAGCGFGGMLIKENKILPQIGAWFLNAIGIQTFALTSGTSECSGIGVVMAEKEQNRFVDANFEDLAKEMAAGEGEHLMTLTFLLGCSTEQAGQIGTFTQEHYGTLFITPETTPTEMLRALKVGLSGKPAFASSCQNI
ncbi:MAG: DUF3015 family protein [Waddliaceae bacterium]